MRTALLFCLAAGALSAARPVPVENGVGAHAQRHLEARVFELGLDRDHSFKARGAQADDLLNEEDVRIAQFYKGVRVFGGESILHVKAGQVRKHTDGLVRGIRLNTTPTLEAQEAVGAAHKALAPKGPYAYQPTSELMIADINGRKALVYHVHTELENGAEETAHTDFFVDAHSGAILDRWSTLQTASVKGQGNSQFSGTVTLDTNSIAGGFEMRDLVRSAGGITVINLNHATSGGTVYTDSDNVWGNGANYTGTAAILNSDPTGQTAAVDASYGLSMAWDMFKNVYGRNGIDGLGTATSSRVHYSSSYDNAFWSDSCFCMTYGDGSSFKSLEALDVVGHEFAHGVMARTANLIYRGESGGLNEANSDIMGTLAEFYAYGANGVGSVIPNTGANYTIGEVLATPKFNKPLRYMYKPSLDAYSPNWWSKSLGRLDVHYSNGPAILWFYLLSQGSGAKASSNNVIPPMTNGVTSIVGIGNQDAGRIWFRAVTKYMTASTNFAGARTATLSAANELFGSTSAQYAAVAKAWLAVNVK